MSPGRLSRWAAGRRALLKGLGLGPLALPLLGAQAARAAGPARRFLCLVHTGGFRQIAWRPREGPLTGALPSSAGPLEPFRNELIFLPELANPHHRGSAEGAYPCVFYGLEDRTDAAEYAEPLGPTVDQVVAGVLPGGPRRSLALHVQIDLPPAPPARGGLRCFWAGANRPVIPEGDPVAVYQRLFAGGVPTRQLLAERKSVLDFVGHSLERWRLRLGSRDRQLVEAHFEAVRETERRLAGLTPPAACRPQPPGAADLKDPQLWPKVLDAQLALAVAALGCGASHVVTIQLSSATGASVDFGAFVPGIPPRAPRRSWVDMAATPIVGGIDQKRLVDTWLMNRFALLLEQLMRAPGPAGTLLDDSVVLWASHMHDTPSAQDPRVAWLLAGRGGGYFKTGQCAPTAGKPLTGVLADICKAFGVPGEPFGPTHGGLQI